MPAIAHMGYSIRFMATFCLQAMHPELHPFVRGLFVPQIGPVKVRHQLILRKIATATPEIIQGTVPLRPRRVTLRPLHRTESGVLKAKILGVLFAKIKETVANSLSTPVSFQY